MVFLKDIFNRNRHFFLPYILILFFSVFPLVFSDKSSVHLCINSANNRFFDFFFRHTTHLGDGLFAVIVAILLLFFSYRGSLFILASYLTGGVFVQLLKKFIFNDVGRPVKFFEGIINLHLAEGVKMRHYMSFPSGHSATAFGLFLCLAILTENKGLKALALVMALIISFSRIYLSQHFLNDVYFGSLIGVVCTIIAYRFVYLAPGKWADKGLVDTISAKNRRDNEN
ncbi:MAG: phosphatase PAP2 family protein [Bacteroidales bacterium]